MIPEVTHYLDEFRALIYLIIIFPIFTSRNKYLITMDLKEPPWRFILAIWFWSCYSSSWLV